MASSDTVTGVCNCGALKVTIPKASFDAGHGLCHCVNCRASSGSLFSVNFAVPTKEIVTEGHPKVYADKDTESGHTVNRNFCGNCGSAIYSIVEESSDVAYVKGGLFAKVRVPLPPPRRQGFMASKEKWEVPIEGIQTVD